LTQPEGLAAAPDGSVLVVDSGQPGLLHLSPDGTLLDRVGGTGSGPGQFQRPTAVAVASDGTIYIVDTGNSRVERFSSGLRYEGEWPVPRADPSLGPLIAVADADEGAVYVVNPLGRQVDRYTRTGHREWSVGTDHEGPQRFRLPLGVATDPRGNLYVLDASRYLVYRFDISRRLP
jgi:DNA-binding beta-propeller fold protein YncE